MAIGGNAAGDYLNLASGAPSGACTYALWVNLTVDRNAIGYIFIAANAAGTTALAIALDTNGTRLDLRTEVGPAFGTDLTVGAWNHVAVTRTGTTKLLYRNGVLDATNSDASNPTLSRFWLLSNSVDHIEGRVAGFKAWSAVLTADEIKQEMRGYLPARTANLFAVNPLFSTADLVDYSGGGITLTGAGTLTTEDGPPIAWSTAVPLIARVAADVTVDLTASPNSVVLATVDPTVILGSLSLNLTASPNAVALTTGDPTVIQGSVTLDLAASPNSLALTTVDPTVSAGGDVSLDLSTAPSTLALTTVDPTMVLSSVTVDLAAAPNAIALTTVDPTVTIADAFALPLSTVTTLARPSAVSAPRRPVGATTQPSIPGAATTLV